MGTLYLDGIPHESMVLDGFVGPYRSPAYFQPPPLTGKPDSPAMLAALADIARLIPPLVKQCEVSRADGTKPFHRKQRDQAA